MGVILGLLVYRYLISRWPAIATFEHELTHALVALLFFRKVTGFVVRREGTGYVRYTDGFGGSVAGHLIGLAPYFLPTFTLILVLVRPLAIDHLPTFWYDLAIGVSFGYQAYSTWDESELSQSDIDKRGAVFSVILIAALTLVTHGLVCHMLALGYGGIGVWMSRVSGISRAFWESAYAMVSP